MKNEVESEEELSPMKPYASDLSDAEWTILEPVIPKASPGGRPRSVDIRQILNGIFSMLRSGCAWRLLPHDYPAWSTVYDYFRKWRNEGLWERIVRTLRERLRVQDGRQATPSAAMIDSQSVKTTECEMGSRSITVVPCSTCGRGIDLIARIPPASRAFNRALNRLVFSGEIELVSKPRPSSVMYTSM